LRTTIAHILLPNSDHGLLAIAPRSFIHALTTSCDYLFTSQAPSSFSLLGFPYGCLVISHRITIQVLVALSLEQHAPLSSYRLYLSG
jgi:hypothetical protein